MKTILSGLLAMVVTFFILPIIRQIALRYKILDFPGGRKVHRIATPLLGGLAIYIGLCAGLFLNYSLLKPYLALFICSSLILVLGLIDDVRGLPAHVRLICEFGITIILITFIPEARISFLPPTILGDLLEVCVTMIWIAGVTNAYNYLDGLDGLASGSCAINSFCLWIILFNTTQYGIALFCAVLCGASIGFLPHNLKKKKIFLGEAGSTFLGFNLACISLIGNWAQDNVVKLFIPILILGVPIFDMIFTTIMRIKEEKVKTVMQWLRYGGKDHFHHYLVDLGLRPSGAVIFIYFITLSLGVSAIAVSSDGIYEMFLTLLHASITFGIVATLMVVGKRRHSGWAKT
ncbi:MAG: undecaprenyl/decaprenyl-phosphate alpha-N-acetylglucosaminyl 1-phosphate transferase [Candidatus Omnitrophica bacterium]|nr:undecaprenyl/decaprenyl-phosphate alpha-N-acetylglucosaminyl 1-phosphate transferase [Candidatus Omnitrophota bacterium]